MYKRQIVVTSGTFTDDAIEFARANRIELVDGKKLMDLIDGVKAPGTKPIEPIAVRVDSKHDGVPSCPKCNATMKHRKAKRGPNAGSEFWGCSTYPKCNGTRQMS